jgi:hypothetical protein
LNIHTRITGKLKNSTKKGMQCSIKNPGLLKTEVNDKILTQVKIKTV